MFYKIKIRKAHSLKWAESQEIRSDDRMTRDIEPQAHRKEVRDGVMISITRMKPSEKDVAEFWDGIEFVKENRHRMPHIEFTAPQTIEIRLVEAGEEVSVHCAGLNVEDADFLVSAPRGIRGWWLDSEVSPRYDRAIAVIGDAFIGAHRFDFYNLINAREADVSILAEIEKILASDEFFGRPADERYSHITEEETTEPEVESETLGDVFGDILNQIR